MEYTNKDIFDYIRTNTILDSNEETKRLYFTDAVLFAKDETLEKEVYNLLSDVCRNIESGSFDLNYEILQSTLAYLDDESIELDDLLNDDFEINYPFDGFSSIYTSDRLDYLNNNNQSDITQALKETDSDIQDACAYWYDRQVENTLYSLRDTLK